MLVVDASVAFAACIGERGFEELPDPHLTAPPLMWSESRSALHRAMRLGRIPPEAAWQALQRLEEAPVRARSHRRLGEEAWRIADEMGWARTYDAEYLALARLLRCPFVTVDRRLHRGSARLGFVFTPTEL